MTLFSLGFFPLGMVGEADELIERIRELERAACERGGREVALQRRVLPGEWRPATRRAAKEIPWPRSM